MVAVATDHTPKNDETGRNGARRRGDGAPQVCPKGWLERAPIGRENQKNRLNKMEEIRSDSENPGKVTLGFSYDYQSRRMQKVVSVREPGGDVWNHADAVCYVYERWNLIAELDGITADRDLWRSYLWGLDLAEQGGALGSQHGNGVSQLAGGVGGLRLITEHTGEEDVYFIYHDANGNVIGLVDADSDASKPAAEYEYDPFGNLIRASGEAAEVSPFRFSTKYEDPESGMYYYGYRYYSPSMGRWLNRDPIGEQGGLNLYGFVRNDPVNRWDWLGLSPNTSGLGMGSGGELDIVPCRNCCPDMCDTGDIQVVGREAVPAPPYSDPRDEESIRAALEAIEAFGAAIKVGNLAGIANRVGRRGAQFKRRELLRTLEEVAGELATGVVPGPEDDLVGRSFRAIEARLGFRLYTVIDYKPCMENQRCRIFFRRNDWDEEVERSTRECPLENSAFDGGFGSRSSITFELLKDCFKEHLIMIGVR